MIKERVREYSVERALACAEAFEKRYKRKLTVAMVPHPSGLITTMKPEGTVEGEEHDEMRDYLAAWIVWYDNQHGR